MSRLLVCSEKDPSSVNIKNCLLSMHNWESVDYDGDKNYYIYNNTVMVIIQDLHLFHENLDFEVSLLGIKVDDVIFMSKHSSKTGKPTLSVHPIGNYHDNCLGGIKEKLVLASPALMNDALRRMYNYNDTSEIQICFEVTHHGPWINKPTFFIEIGSDSLHWNDKHLAHIIAHVISDINPQNEYLSVIGVGGGHYAPQFTSIAMKYKINFGHMIPNYHIKNRDDEDIIRMVKAACTATSTKLVYIHNTPSKKSDEQYISDLISSSGFEKILTSDLDPINAN